MRVSQIAGYGRVNNSEKYKYISVPNQTSSKNGINPDNFFRIYSGRDLVSFKSSDLNTVKSEYFHLPEGAAPDSFQIEAGRALSEGKNVIVEAPTGTGKTAVAYYAASKNMRDGKTTFYTTPLKALSNQKLNEFKAIFGDKNVGILTGDRRENADAPIVIMTTEVYRNMALSKLYGNDVPLMDNLGTVILDECHYLGDNSRGATWEESIMLTPKDVQMLALSATIGNPDEIEKWMNNITEKDVHLVSIPSSERHVPLEFDSIFTNSYKYEEKRIRRDLAKKGYINSENDCKTLSKPTLSDFKNSVDTLAKKEQLPAIFFIFSRKFSRELLEYLNAEGAVLTTPEEQKEIEKIVEKYKSEKYIGTDLNTDALKKGYAVHNAGIIPAQKELVEELFQKKLIKAVIATETLAAGINMPAKTVIISSPYKPDDCEEGEESLRALTSNEFKQMAGRAGRRGIDTVGYVYTMPTDRSTEQEFLMLEAIDCNSLKSSYEPDYSFLTGYYEHNPNKESLKDIYSNTFYAYDKNNSARKAKTDELIDISEKKTKILENLGFVKNNNGLIEVTPLGIMASQVRGYDALTLVEAISSKKFDGITPEALAMIAGAVANPAKPKDFEIGNGTDLSYIFDSSADNVANLKRTLQSKISENLKKLGKSITSFNSYEELYKYVQGLQKPENTEEVEAELEKMQKIRARMYKITKLTGKYSINEVIASIKNGETLPTKTLEYYLEQLNMFKSGINAKDIDTYIEKLNNELSQFDTSSKGKKAKARNEKKSLEIKREIEFAQAMKLLDEKLVGLISDNYNFIKRYPPEKVKRDYYDAEEKYTRMTSKDALLSHVEGLMNLEKYLAENDVITESRINHSKVKSCISELIKHSMSKYTMETEKGIKPDNLELGKSAAEILYIWAYLNRVNPDSMSNWMQLIRIIPESDADEGTIYREILQGADLLSQIRDIAKAGMECAQTEEDRNYYAKLKDSALEARNLIIKNPIIV